tara:strand:+ start:477 stop:674 length:198 start_codon:yes stop_codon:yes gene_type:complete
MGEKISIIIYMIKENEMQKVKETKKVELTKVALVRQVEEKFSLNKGDLDSLERSNKVTIKKLLSL